MEDLGVIVRVSEPIDCLLSGVPLFAMQEAAQDYDRVKLALMKRYDLTEDGYRHKFRASKPEVDESPEQFIVRLDRYLYTCYVG